MNDINDIARQLIILLQQYCQSLGFTPVIHFELEGCYQLKSPRNAANRSAQQQTSELNFAQINQILKQLNIKGKLVAEYWHNQWEYVSNFDGQLPLEEADSLTKVISLLPKIMAQQGVEKTLIKPVVWAGDKGKLAPGCANVFSGDDRAVHIPNAIQMNISVNNAAHENIVSQSGFGEYLQQCFLQTSLACSLLYLPEEEAFERFALKSVYGLEQELCSPSDISGGHQGSIALYKELGKHNQAMGETTLLYDHHHRVIATEQNWRTSARIEHRLGASSTLYNAYVNVVFALLNVVDAIEVYLAGQCQQLRKTEIQNTSLPTSLYSKGVELGAIELFQQEQWFAKRSNEICLAMGTEQMLGDKLKYAVLASYQQAEIVF